MKDDFYDPRNYERLDLIPSVGPSWPEWPAWVLGLAAFSVAAGVAFWWLGSGR